MRTKFYLASLALAAMAVGCQNEDFIEKTAQNADGLVELDENFMIASVSEDAATRTHWDLKNGYLVNAFLPTWMSDPGTDAIANHVKSDEIGLCWTGVSADGTGTSGSAVLTNYQFFHFGWLGEGQEAADLGQCPDDGLQNGWLYDEVKKASGATISNDTEVSKDEVTATNKEYNNKTLVFDKVNLNSGIYKTDNKAIFGGEYIAYYPYNPDFKDKGCIPAVSKTVYDDVKVGEDGLTDPKLGEATFRYSDVAVVNGGAEATKFGFNNLSGLLYLQVNNTTDAPTDKGNVNIDKVVFYSANSAFKKAVKLDASSIKAKKKGTALYAETVETSKSITVNIEENNGEYLIVAKKGDATSFITVAALPTTISDLKVLMHNGASGKEGWAEYAIGETKVNAGQPTFLKLTVALADFKKVFYATDQATLDVALAQAAAVPTESKPATVKVLGDITLTKDVEVNAGVIVEGDKLIVPEGMTLTLKDGATVKSGIDVLGQTCCGKASAAGKLVVKAANLAGKVHAYNGYVDKESATVELANPETPNAKAFLTGSMILDSNTDLKIVSTADFNTKGAKIENNGEFTVEGKFAVLDASGTTDSAAGKDFTNNGTFIDKIGSTVGGATQFMVNNGDYICEVESQKRMDEAYSNKKACNIIDVQKKGEYILNAIKHANKDVDIWVSAGKEGLSQEQVLFQSPFTYDKNGGPVYSRVTIGNLVIKSGKRAFIKSTAMISVNGDITVGGDFVLNADVAEMTAKNLTVNNGGIAKFLPRTSSNKVTLAVEKTISVKYNGTFEIRTPSSAAENIALVTCRKLVEGGTFTGGKPEIVE